MKLTTSAFDRIGKAVHETSLVSAPRSRLASGNAYNDSGTRGSTGVSRRWPQQRPKGAHNKLGEEFLTQLCDDFEAHGAAVIERVRQEDPATYIRVIASLVPRDIKIDRRLDAGPLSDLTGDELAALLYAARNAVAMAKDT